MNAAGGKLIVFEGIDGAGTTTQAQRLKDELLLRNEHVVLTAEPSTGVIGQTIWAILRGQLDISSDDGREPSEEVLLGLLFSADRAHHLRDVMQPALHSGKHVICDRYYASTLAYQSQASPMEWLRELNRFCRRPDITIFLDVPPNVALERKVNAGGGRERYERLDALRTIHEQYLRTVALLRREGERIVTIDAAAALETVRDAVLEAVAPVVNIIV